VKLFDLFVDIIQGSHILEIIFMVYTSSFASPPCDHPTLFTRVRGRGVFGSLHSLGALVLANSYLNRLALRAVCSRVGQKRDIEGGSYGE
jgi:hypothetical protein